MSRKVSLLLLFVTAAALSLSPLIGMADEPVARFFVFEAQDCDHCHVVEEEVLAPLAEEYGDRVEIKQFDIGSVANYEVMVRLEREYGVSGQAIPEVFIGDSVLVGEDEIAERLQSLVDGCLSAGGCEFPSEDEPAMALELSSEGLAAAVCEEQTGAAEGGVCEVVGGELAAPVSIAYFYSPGCVECDRVGYDLSYLEQRHVNLDVRSFDISTCAPLNEAICERYGVPPEERLMTPAVFIGDECLIGDEISVERLEELIVKYGQEPCVVPWEGLEEESSTAVNRIIQRFKSFSAVAVLGAGLLDGVNPCAFTTIIFFVSYLAVMGRKGRDILLVGVSFTVAVFITYLLVGVGVLGFVHSLGIVKTFSRVVYLATGAFCLVLAGFSLFDVYRIKQGRIEDIALKLPERLQKRVHQTIREGRNVRNYVWAAFVTGFLVSLLELACTGQVYLPTIIFVSGVPELRVNALVYLVLYNLMFILPLVIIFVLVFYGTTSKQLTGFFRANAASVKLLTALLFAALGFWLLYSMI
jgi:sulfite exporter TauE/SafE